MTIGDYIRRRVRISALVAVAGLAVPAILIAAFGRPADPITPAILTIIGVLVFGFAYFRAVRTKCPQCRNGLFMIVAHIALPTLRARIHFCPFCGKDFDGPYDDHGAGS